VRAKLAVERYLAGESGATAIEYALIVGIIATALIGIAATGGAVEALYNTMSVVADTLSP
jgi:Flp pilus assembly pilin Flp